jgi:hypothetical protein
MNAVFTIVARNFMPQARTLGDSLARTCPGLPFHIVLADEAGDGLDLSRERYPTVEARDVGLPAYLDMAFKYDLVEFATSIKPFVFDHLFERHGYDKILYVDPDMCAYRSLDEVFDALDDHFIYLTPHMLDIARSGFGAISEETILFVGTYNLGFVGLNSSKDARTVVDWWKARLAGKGYADRQDALHVDQKWMDLIPGFFDRGVLVSRHAGMNVAHWNMHEREVTFRDGEYRVNGQPLLLFHFSGFDPSQPDKVTGAHKQTLITLDDRPAYRPLFLEYAANLARNQDGAAQLPYAFHRFRDGTRIYAFHRRLYRKLTACGFQFDDPFAVGPGSFHDHLERNGLLMGSSGQAGEIRQKDIPHAGAKLKLLQRGMALLRRVIGMRYYTLLLRTLLVLCRPEEQVFLLRTLRVDVPLRFGMIPGAAPVPEKDASPKG